PLTEVVFVADELDELGIRHQALLDREGKWPSERLGVVHRDLDLERADIEPPKAFGHFQLVARRCAVLVDPRLIPEARGLNDERVALPVTGGVPIPPRLNVACR